METLKLLATAFVASVFVLHGGFLRVTSAQRGTQTPSTSAEEWRTSWTAFAQLTKEVFLADPSFPRKSNMNALNLDQEGYDLLTVGLPTDPSVSVMKRFSGSLEFGAKLTKVETDANKLMKGQPFKLELEMTEPGLSGWMLKPMHVYPKAVSLEKWKSVAIGTAFRFRARLAGIRAWSPARIPQSFEFGCAVLLTDAELVDGK